MNNNRLHCDSHLRRSETTPTTDLDQFVARHRDAMGNEGISRFRAMTAASEEEEEGDEDDKEMCATTAQFGTNNDGIMMYVTLGTKENWLDTICV